MGLEFDPKRYGMRDYAAEFSQKAKEMDAFNRGVLAGRGITVPIGKENVEAKAEDVSPEDAVRSDLGVSLGNAQKVEDTDNVEGAGEVKPEEVKEEVKQAPTAPLPEEKINENIMFEEGSVVLKKPRTLTTDTARDTARNEAETQFLQDGTKDGQKITDPKQAREYAENYVENKENLENFYSTRTYLTKDEYKAAQKEVKNARGDYYQSLRNKGVGRREARRRANAWADANLVHNERLKNKDALKYVEAHRDQFYDENGNFSQTKFKQFSEGLMNTHTQEGETRNGHLSLKERREAAQNLKLDDDAVCDMVHRAGGNFEKDYTELKQIGIIGGATIVTTVAGALLAPTITASSGAASGAATGAGAGAGAGAGSTAGAAAGATVSISGYGAAAGIVPLSIGGYIKNKLRDNGGIEPRVYEPGKKTEPPVKEEPPVETPEKDDEPEVCILEPDEAHEVVKQEVNYCPYPVRPGDDWAKVALAKYRVQTGTDEDGEPITRPVTRDEALKIAHELKMAHGIARKDFNKCIFPKVGEELKLYNEFDGLYHKDLKGVKFIVDCEAQTDGKMSRRPSKSRYQRWNGQYNGAVRDHNIDMYWYQDCSNRRSNIFSTAAERDAEMARKQAEIDAAARK